jgi:hypothetical protein
VDCGDIPVTPYDKCVRVNRLTIGWQLTESLQPICHQTDRGGSQGTSEPKEFSRRCGTHPVGTGSILPQSRRSRQRWLCPSPYYHSRRRPHHCFANLAFDQLGLRPRQRDTFRLSLGHMEAFRFWRLAFVAGVHVCHTFASFLRSDVHLCPLSSNHGTYFYHAAQEGLIRNGTSVHAGIRTTVRSRSTSRISRLP